jgi:transaldolase
VNLSTKIFADGADLDTIVALADDPRIQGFTTNPTLMCKAGVDDYAAFAIGLLDLVGERPVSFEVVSDALGEIEEEAREIARWGDNVYVKVPVTTTSGVSSAQVIHRLAHDGVKVNVTAVFTLAQVETVASALDGGAPCVVSVLAGRIADTGRNPLPLMREAVGILASNRHAELLWASPREVLNVVQASDIGCHIVTLTPDLLAKLGLLGKDLDEFSLETVRMFHDDARRAGLTVHRAGLPT